MTKRRDAKREFNFNFALSLIRLLALNSNLTFFLLSTPVCIGYADVQANKFKLYTHTQASVAINITKANPANNARLPKKYRREV